MVLEKMHILKRTKNKKLQYFVSTIIRTEGSNEGKTNTNTNAHSIIAKEYQFRMCDKKNLRLEIGIFWIALLEH